MRETDFDDFSDLLDDVAVLVPPAQPLGGTAKALYFRALAEYPLAAVRAALDAHVKDPQRGRWFPRPADLIAQLQGLQANDGRPGAEEAWAIALQSADEAASVVWTDEIAEAMGVARPVMQAGDKVGARMAFREAYERLVDAARRQGRKATWTASLGHDRERHADVVRRGVEAGLLPRIALESLQPPPGQPLLALAGPAPSDSKAAALGRAALRALRDRLAGRAPEPEPLSKDAQAKQWTAQRKAELAAKVQGVGM